MQLFDKEHPCQGADSIKRCHLTSIGSPIVDIRRSYNSRISTTGFGTRVRRHLYIESGPCILNLAGNRRAMWKLLQYNSGYSHWNMITFIHCEDNTSFNKRIIIGCDLWDYRWSTFNITFVVSIHNGNNISSNHCWFMINMKVWKCWFMVSMDIAPLKFRNG